MNALPLPAPAYRPRKRPNRNEAKIVSNARAIMELLARDATNPKTKPLARASIARSYAILGDAIRVWRGIPSPGQLRPDLDPVQLAKALKRHRGRSPMLDMPATFAAPEEPDPKESAPDKESLSEPGPVPAPPPPDGA